MIGFSRFSHRPGIKITNKKPIPSKKSVQRNLFKVNHTNTKAIPLRLLWCLNTFNRFYSLICFQTIGFEQVKAGFIKKMFARKFWKY